MIGPPGCCGVRMCVCVSESKREGGREGEREMYICIKKENVGVCVCVCERGSE
jgi:hypothetical protein